MSLKKLFLLTAAVILFSIPLLEGKVFASSSIHKLDYPFLPDDKWVIVQGYGVTNGTGTHSVYAQSNYKYYLDLTIADTNGLANNEKTKNAVVIAAVDGVISSTTPVRSGTQGYKTTIVTDDGYKVHYTHVNQNLLVTPGTRVTKGTPIATVFPVSLGGFVHLDFGIENPYGTNIPLTFGVFSNLNDIGNTPSSCPAFVYSQHCGKILTSQQKFHLQNLSVPNKGNLAPVYRFHNLVGNQHLLTIGISEKNSVHSRSQWKLEDIVFYVPMSSASNNLPIYRLRKNTSPSINSYLYVGKTERDSIIVPGSSYRDEGIAFYAFSTQIAGTVPVYRMYHPIFGKHMFTTSTSERDSLRQNGFTYEGIAFYAYSRNTCHTNNRCPVFKLFHTETGRHLYSTQLDEIIGAMRADSRWNFEGVEFYSMANPVTLASPTTTTFYRYRNSQGSYRLSSASSLSGWARETATFNVYVPNLSVLNTLPIYEYYNSSLNTYHYTRTKLSSTLANWVYQGEVFRAFPSY
jgi:hypothetical protein